MKNLPLLSKKSSTKLIFAILAAFFLPVNLITYSFAAAVSGDTLIFDNEKVTIDIYDPELPNCPAAILIHGAAGITGDRALRYRKFAADLMNKGILAINVHYFESSKERWLDTISQTITYATKLSNVDSSRICLIGYSLGGTIAIKAASTDKRVSLLAINAGYMPQGFSKADARRLPKTFMVSGTKDASIQTLNSLKSWLSQAGIPFEEKILQGYGHSVPMNMFEDNWQSMVSFIVRSFKP